ncbi:hypothetical protein BDK92_6364 [Micromonospora pisi]|uniref:Cytochrome P450 n=1 Tax=Micromonospora pisi TaxID=589240 RepID=A0A495JSI6_9ACTN|nr:cytochrome P450 [Micromonospora pisi]RKR91933.1 hypothetical protein BDK92_6364 [Micromonospora pisi]
MAKHTLTEGPPSQEDGGQKLLDWARGLRETSPVWQEEQTGAWHVLGYTAVQRVLSDYAAFSSDLGVFLSSESFREGNYQLMDPPLHQRYRGLVNQAFTPRAIRRLTPRVTSIVNSLLDAAGDPERLDLVETLAHPMPVTVLAELLGVPAADHGLLRGWADDLFRLNFDDRFDPEKAKLVDAAVQPMHDYLLELVRERRKSPREDLISDVVQAKVDDESLGDEEAVTAAGGLLFAGHLTTTLLLGNAVRCLDEHPAITDGLRADPEGIPAVVEEVMRYRPPFSIVVRLTKTEVTLGPETIPAGSMVVPSLLAANRDPDHFPNPELFDPGRNNSHVAFGHGAHYCIGASLARLEGKIALGILLKRYPKLRLDESGTPEYYAAPGLFGPKRLPVVLR